MSYFNLIYCFTPLSLLLLNINAFYYSLFRIQIAGLGGLKPNTVILGWPNSWQQSENDRSWQVFLQTIRIVTAAKMALIVPKGIRSFPDSATKVKRKQYISFFFINANSILSYSCMYSYPAQSIFGGSYTMEEF